MSILPWEVHPALTEERLIAIGRLIAKVRHKAIESHEPQEGDGPWGLGCRVHERTCYALSNAAVGIHQNWLSVIEPGLHFVFAIGGVPVRFYRGDPDRPPRRSLQRNRPERVAQQQQFAFYGTDEEADEEYFWRLAIETDDAQRVLRAVFTETSESGRTRNPWTIPLDSPVKAATLVAEPREGKVLPPPKLGLRPEAHLDADGDASEAGDASDADDASEVGAGEADTAADGHGEA